MVVGGLGLGYTAEAALRHDRVGELLVVDALGTVIRWHEEEKVPWAGRLMTTRAAVTFTAASSNWPTRSGALTRTSLGDSSMPSFWTSITLPGPC